jgi:ribosomal protein S18 acetylase RimI-like enzyme
MPDFRLLVPDEWLTLRDIRLTALRESPHAFLSTFAQEKTYDEARWRAEFVRGDWTVGIVGGQPVSLIGATREPDMPVDQCYLEYLWVSPKIRRCGMGYSTITVVLDFLKGSGVRTVFLWVLDGNDIAMRLYKRVGFVSSNDRQPLDARPGLSEERLQLDLG